MGALPVNSLGALGEDTVRLPIRAPSNAGTYYYGASVQEGTGDPTDSQRLSLSKLPIYSRT